MTPMPKSHPMDAVQRARLRSALARADEDDENEPESAERFTARSRRTFAKAAMIFVILATLWHEGIGGSLFLLETQSSARAHIRLVRPTEAHSESTKMSHRTTASASIAATMAATTAATMIVSSAIAQDAGYAQFGAVTDTIRISGNTVFPTVDYTYEMRVRIQPGSPTGLLIAEQRDMYEAKSVSFSSTETSNYMTRGYACGTDSVASLAPNFAGEWRHVAWVRSGSNGMLFIDGQLTNSWVFTATCAGNSPDSRMSIGLFRPLLSSVNFPSCLFDLDWIHVSAGARYTSSFVPPFECEVAADSDTQLLLKFNEPAGTTVLIDESPSHFQCDVGVYGFPPVASTSPILGNIIDGFPACPLCSSDIDEDGSTNGTDLAIILAHWGSTAPKGYPRADTNADGTINGFDLAVILDGWGTCP